MANINVRNIPDELYKLLKKRAKEDQRSVNQEVIWLLQKELSLRDDLERQEAFDSLEELQKKFLEEKRTFLDPVKLIRKDRER